MKTAHFWHPALDPAQHALVRISIGSPRFLRKGQHLDGVILDLAPDRWMLKDLGDDEAAYREAYLAKLNRIGAAEIGGQLAVIQNANPGKDLVLLCFEDFRKPGLWCHRSMFAQWWTQQTGEEVQEMTFAQPALLSGKTKTC